MPDDGAVNTINKKLSSEAEWLSNFKANVARSRQIGDGVENLVEKFEHRIQSLEKNVLPIHVVNGKLQRKQNNIQKLISTIDATLQFYGRTNTVENAIRNNNPLTDMQSYLGNMECLQQAINFFEAHPNYANQTENMKVTLDIGFTILEKSFRSLLQSNTVEMDAAAFAKFVSENGILSAEQRLAELRAVNNEEPIIKLATWFLKQNRTQFLGHYSEYRGGFMLKTIQSILQNYKSFVNGARVKSTKKSGTRNEKLEKKENEITEVEGCLLICISLLSLLETEEKFLVKAIPDTTRRAQVFRELVSRPLSFVIGLTFRVVQEKDPGITPLLPLLQFLSENQARFHNLATNSSADVNFEQMMRVMQVKCSSYLTEAVVNLNEDSNKFVPPDGNVHPTTATTLNFLSSLTVHRVSVTHQVLAMTAPQGHNPSFLLPKLFARVLSALGSMLKKKCEYYDDPTLATMFLLNNYNYIAKTLADEEDGLLPVISEQNTNILSFYQTEISNCLRQYMQSWSGVINSLQSVNRIGDDKNAARDCMMAFVREFEQVLAQQADYCVSDVKMASEIRSKVKQSVWKGYAPLLDACQKLHAFPQGLKYTESSLQTVIDNLFSSARITH
ncbi:unnamed protein product [Caenorhabditis auriculariae]|uniref:Exocyst complex component 7 n=1 Tax=Caenorhabditis auriculariae TaxID=2777116 RepID=A0A8S1GMC1_9PELO|nr:unnamed protein product [Caenorhabditis auriculariae]